MGIKGLFKFLRGYRCNREIDLRSLTNKVVAIDIATYIYKRIMTTNDLSEALRLIFYFLAYFRRHFIHLFVVFDSKPPIQKNNTIQKRNDERERKLMFSNTLEFELNEYRTTGMMSIHLQQVGQDEETESIDMFKVQRKIEHIRKQTVRPTPDLIRKLKRLLRAMGIPFIDAPTEAERYCASLKLNGLVDYVVTEDSDTLVYGTSIVSKIETKSHSGLEFCHDEILSELNLTKHEFRDFCILCGTDYNERIRGIGPNKGLEKLKSHKLEDLMENVDPIRKLFDLDTVKSIEYCTPPDFLALNDFFNDEEIVVYGLEKILPNREIMFV